MAPFYRLMLITQKKKTPLSQYINFIKHCADGGITSLQLREKTLDTNELIELGLLLKEILAPYHIPLVINDNTDLALNIGTPYVHLGQQDDSIDHALKIYPSAQLGISIESLGDIIHANRFANIAYVTASAVFPTTNKSNITTYWGLEGIKELSQMSMHPLTAIGGITIDNLDDVIKHGAKGVAVIGAIHDSPTPYQTTKKIRGIIDSILD
ncbi:MAG: thiamine phosphate synthase [Brevinema sp.]